MPSNQNRFPLLHSRHFLAVALLLFFAISTAEAHKLNMFSYVEGEEIYIEAYFADGKRAKNSAVKVYDPQEQLVYDGMTDDEGGHQFPTPKKTDLKIVVDAGMGHQTSYTLLASELAGEPSNTTAVTPSHPAADAPTEVITTAATPPTMNIEQIKPIITQAVSQAVKPLQREISEMKSKTSMSDIIGGIGYIIGLLGLFAYLEARKQTKK